MLSFVGIRDTFAIRACVFTDLSMGKQMTDKTDRKAEIKKRANARKFLIARYKLHKFSSNTLIAAKLAEELGLPTPSKRVKVKRLIYSRGVELYESNPPSLVLATEDTNSKPKPAYNPRFYDSRQWRELRYIALRNSQGRCNLCGATADDCVILHVDHIKPRSLYPDLEMDLDNLQVLCEDCNIGKTNAWEDDWRGLTPIST